MQMPLGFLLPKSDWEPPALSSLPQDWNSFGRVCIDAETKDPTLKELGIGTRRGGHVVGYSVGFEDGPSVYLPIRHKDGGNLDAHQVNGYMQDQAARYKGTLVNAKLDYDLDYLWEEKIFFPQVKAYRDPLIAEVLIDELQHRYNLNSVSQKYLALQKDEALLNEAAAAYGSKNPKNILWHLHSKFVGPYAERDNQLPMRVLRMQERILEEQGLWKVYDLESAVQPVLVRMRRRGVRVNIEKLNAIDQWALEQEQLASDEIKNLTGYRVEVGNFFQAEQFERIFNAAGIPIERTATGGVSITKEWMANLNHPLGALIRRARKMSQLRSTFVNSVRRYLIIEPNGRYGRLHCTFNQLRGDKSEDNETGLSDLSGAITGRLSCEHLNLQQQPGDNDKEIGRRWRDIYEPEEGAIWGAADYSQQEPRGLVHWAICAGAKRIGYEAHQAAIEFGRRYREDPRTDFHNMTATFINPDFPTLESTDKAAAAKVRKGAKVVGLARIYGRGGASMCRELGLPTQQVTRIINGKERSWEGAGVEGQRIIDSFDRAVPFAKKMLDADRKQAEDLGFVRTWSERRLHFEKSKYREGEYDRPYSALNKRVQGSAADQTKVALVELDRAGHYIQIQVHDEVDGSFESEKRAREAAEIMENCIPLKVPSKVDLELGPSWGQAK